MALQDLSRRTGEEQGWTLAPLRAVLSFAHVMVLAGALVIPAVAQGQAAPAQQPAAAPPKPAPAQQSAPANQAPSGPVVGGASTQPQASPQAGGKPKRAPAVVAFGMVAGGHLRNWFENTSGQGNQFSDTSGRLLIGPTLQIHWKTVALEIDALYRGYRTHGSGSILGISFVNDSNGRAWEFPILLKRKFYPTANIKPVFGAGVAIRYLGQQTQLVSVHTPDVTASVGRNYVFGIPLSAGLEFKAARFRFMPEFRYVLWASETSLGQIRTQGLFDTNHSQFQLLLGFTF